MQPRPEITVQSLNERSHGALPGHLGVEVTALEAGRLEARLVVRPHHMAPNGYLHAGTVVSLADTAAGYACVAHLPDGAAGFTTVELKTNLLGTEREGAIACTATLLHGGRSTQVWDATVRRERDGQVIAVFRCTQMILYPRA
ncbi:MAG: PaaI family thioesterase [Piscinibacter sp.]|nr:PaaI family thioesterase [Piscinibacter sp.]